MTRSTGYNNQTFTIEITVTGSLDGVTIGPASLQSPADNDDPQQLYRSTQENLGLIDIDSVVEASGPTRLGSRGHRYIPFIWIEGPTAADATALVDIVDAVDGSISQQKLLGNPVGVLTFYRESVVVGQGSLLRVRGFAATAGTPVIVRVAFVEAADPQTLMLAQQAQCLCEQTLAAQELCLNVQSFGAVGDGVTDDTSAIQDAINAAEAIGGGTVCFPPGTYLTTSTLLIDGDRVRLQGEGWNSTITNTTLNGPIVTVAADEIQLDNLRILGSSALAAQNCVRIAGIHTQLYLKLVYMEGCGGPAFRCENAGNVIVGCTIDDCVVDDCGRGITFVIGASRDIEIRNLKASDNLQAMVQGIAIDRNISDVRIFGGDIQAAIHGISVNASRDVLIDGVTIHDIDDSTGEGIHIETAENEQQTRRITIRDCRIRDCVNFGVSCSGTPIGAGTPLSSAHIRVSGCNISQCDVGVLIQDCVDVDVLDCDSFENDTHGFNVLGNGNGIDPFRIKVRGGQYYNNGQVSTGFGVRIGTNVTRCKVEDTDCYDDQGTPTQDIGINVVDDTDIQQITIRNNRCQNINRGIEYRGGQYFKIEDNWVLDAGDFGILASAGTLRAGRGDVHRNDVIGGVTSDAIRINNYDDMYSEGSRVYDTTGADAIAVIAGSSIFIGPSFVDAAVVGGEQGIATTSAPAATILGSVTNSLELFDETGTSVGFVPVYDTIT